MDPYNKRVEKSNEENRHMSAIRAKALHIDCKDEIDVERDSSNRLHFLGGKQLKPN